MSDWYLGEIRMFAGTFAPSGWAFCDGRELSIAEHMSLYSLIGTTYGTGAGQSFRLPDLRGRLPIHTGSGPGLTSRSCGMQVGAQTATMAIENISTHSHLVNVGGAGQFSDPEGHFLADNVGYRMFKAQGNVSVLNEAAVGMCDGAHSRPHDNMMPTLCLNFIIAITGDNPSA